MIRVYKHIALPIILLGITTTSWAQSKNSNKSNTINSVAIAKMIAKKGQKLVFPGSYQGTLISQAITEIGTFEDNGKYLSHVRALYTKFGTGKIKSIGNFISYQAGGSGAAYLVYNGCAPELKPQVLTSAQKMVARQPRSSEGLMMRLKDKGDKKDPIFIDVAFAVTPYLLYTGLAFNRDDFVKNAVFQTVQRINILKDLHTGLVHQARGFQSKGYITKDNWSRGNGWAALALADLIRNLPENYPERDSVEYVARHFFKAICKYQDQKGLWHQEMTDTTSYIETSGSALLLYGLGVAIQQELLGVSYRIKLKKGLINLLAYVKKDGSVSHTSTGCLAPGQGRKIDYERNPWAFNDPHAFGSLALAFTQAAKMGISTLTIPFPLGHLATTNSTPKMSKENR